MILVTGCNGVLGSAFKKINKSKEFYYLSGRKEVNLCSQNETNNFSKKKNFRCYSSSGCFGWSWIVRAKTSGNPVKR